MTMTTANDSVETEELAYYHLHKGEYKGGPDLRSAGHRQAVG
jgi:hypothetical protein